MAKRNTMSVDFTGVERYMEKLREFEGATEKAVAKALEASQHIVAEKAKAAMQPHFRPETGGKTAKTIIDNPIEYPVEWTQTTARIPVGFDLEKSGLIPIFLMYGTTVNGKKHASADKNLYAAIYGKATKAEVHAQQEKAFKEVIKDVFGDGK